MKYTDTDTMIFHGLVDPSRVNSGVLGTVAIPMIRKSRVYRPRDGKYIDSYEVKVDASVVFSSCDRQLTWDLTTSFDYEERDEGPYLVEKLRRAARVLQDMSDYLEQCNLMYPALKAEAKRLEEESNAPVENP